MPSLDPIGLCRTCRHAATTRTASGSIFYRCRLSETDNQFPKYPPLPVLRCRGYEPLGDTGGAASWVSAR